MDGRREPDEGGYAHGATPSPPSAPPTPPSCHDPAYAAGLESVVTAIGWKISRRAQRHRYRELYDPAADPALAGALHGGRPGRARPCARRPCSRRWDLPRSRTRRSSPCVTRLVGHKGLDLVQQALDGIMATGCQLVVLGTGDGQYEDFFRWTPEPATRAACAAQIGYAEDLSSRIYAGSGPVPDALPQRALRPEPDDRHALRRGAHRAADRRSERTPCRSCQVGQDRTATGYLFRASYDTGGHACCRHRVRPTRTCTAGDRTRLPTRVATAGA